MKRNAALTLLIVYAGLIAFLSLAPKGPVDVGEFDKSAHFLSYTVFALIASLVRLPTRRFALLCAGIVLYSGLMEFGQSFVPNREMSFLDFVANSMGVAVGYLASRWFAARWGSSNAPL